MTYHACGEVLEQYTVKEAWQAFKELHFIGTFMDQDVNVASTFWLPEPVPPISLLLPIILLALLYLLIHLQLGLHFQIKLQLQRSHQAILGEKMGEQGRRARRIHLEAGAQFKATFSLPNQKEDKR